MSGYPPALGPGSQSGSQSLSNRPSSSADSAANDATAAEEPSSPHDSEEPLDLSRSRINGMDSGPEDDEEEDESEPSMDSESAPCGPEENEDESIFYLLRAGAYTFVIPLGESLMGHYAHFFSMTLPVFVTYFGLNYSSGRRVYTIRRAASFHPPRCVIASSGR